MTSSYHTIQITLGAEQVVGSSGRAVVVIGALQLLAVAVVAEQQRELGVLVAASVQPVVAVAEQVVARVARQEPLHRLIQQRFVPQYCQR